ncbi:pilus assembly protein TadE [Nocardia stercoris]|uniref:Pilus assembly protein TadE n=1 Tax=Nocardia stercoris TaxID=2483361 RepID=A0A3M2KV74_9NOCA|nr:pilus assembly protein TadE [Nocardia stercoris]
MTVEAAIALSALVIAVALCLGAVLAAGTQVRCVDAAREAARLAARGATDQAVPSARRVGPPGAEVTLRLESDRIVADVTARTPLLPLLVLHAQAVAVPEPGVVQ